MQGWILCGVVLCLLAGIGCNSPAPGAGEAEPVSFDHPDEVIRGEGFMVLADRRVFAVMAFLNAAGWSEEVKGKQMHPVRVRVREMVSVNLSKAAQKVRSWRQYCETHKFGTFCYQDFALSLSADYPFRRIRPDAELGYAFTAAKLREFPDILNDFWVTAKLDDVWNAVKDDYLAELAKYDFQEMQRQMAFLWEYLGMERQDTFTIVSVPNLLDRYYTAIGAKYENRYYAVESPGAIGHRLNTHEYLHSIVNGLMASHHEQQREKLLQYYETGKNGPSSRSYQHPVTFAYECLVHALDYRLRVLQTDNATVKKAAETRVAKLTDAGLNLTQPFYDLLIEYEASGAAFDEFFPILLERLPAYGQ